MQGITKCTSPPCPNSAMAPRVHLVFVTCPTRAAARRLAAALVTRRLAACVNILPGVESIFWWEGKMSRSREALLLLKTTKARLGTLTRAILTLHPYEVPEVIAVPVTAGHGAYLRWVASSVSGGH